MGFPSHHSWNSAHRVFNVDIWIPKLFLWVTTCKAAWVNNLLCAQMVLNSYITCLSLDESFLPLLSNKSDILPWIPRRLEMALSNHHQLLMSYKLKGKWVDMCSHKEYLTSDSMSFFICTNFHTKMVLALLKMHVWINQINSTSAPFAAFFSIALFLKGYINKSCKLPYAFVELGMNSTICMVSTWKNSQIITGQILPYTDQKRKTSVPPQLLPHLRNQLYCICFPVFLSERWCILCFSLFQINPGNQLSNWRAAARAFMNRNVQ